MDATGEDLPELPGIVPNHRLVGAVHRGLHDDRRRAVAAPRRTAIDQILHICVQACHVEGAVLHADVDIIGPRVGVLQALGARQDMPGMPTEVVDRLPGCQ